MLSWSIAFLVLALVAAVFGFGWIASTAVDIAQVLFFIFIVLFVMSLVFRTARKVDDEIDRGL